MQADDPAARAREKALAASRAGLLDSRVSERPLGRVENTRGPALAAPNRRSVGTLCVEVKLVWVVRMLLFLVLVVVVTGFAMLNGSERASVVVWPGSLVFYDVPLVLLLFEAFVLGAIVWFVVSVFHEVNLRTAIRRLKRETADLHQEIAGLRSISLDVIEGESSDEEP